MELVEHSLWSWVKIMECIGKCQKWCEACDCEKVSSTNWFLLEIRPNGQDRMGYYLRSNILVIEPGHVLVDSPLYVVNEYRPPKQMGCPA